MIKCLQISSSVIGLSAVAMYCRGFPVDAALVGAQSFFAIIYHTFHTPETLWLDRASTFSLVARTCYMSTMHPTAAVVTCSYLSYMYLIYGYGYRNKCFSFDPDTAVGDRYHCTLHYGGMLLYHITLSLI